MLWLDGERCDGPVAPFDLRDRGLLLGDGLFDTAMVLNGQIVFGGAHFDRLARGCAQLGIPFARAQTEATAGLAAREIGTGAIRVTVTHGPGPRGLAPPADPTPRIIVSGAPGLPALVCRPLRLAPTTIRRNETSPASRLKSLGYLDAVVAAREAAEQGAGEALFLNTQGRVACAGTGNLFAVRGRQLLTPPLVDGVLDGITRAVLLHLAGAAGLTAAVQSLKPEDLLSADGVFLTNSLRLIAPVTVIGETPIATRAETLITGLTDVLRDRITRECGTAAVLGKDA